MSINDKGIHKGVFLLIVLICLVVLISLLRKDMQLLPSLEGLSTKSLRINDSVVHVTVAKTPEEMATNLRDTRTIAPNQGMMFVSGKEGIYSISTKDMHFPVDVLWLDSDGFVVDMQTDIPQGIPYSISTHVLARYVLIMPAGAARSTHVEQGTYIFLPDFNY